MTRAARGAGADGGGGRALLSVLRVGGPRPGKPGSLPGGGGFALLTRLGLTHSGDFLSKLEGSYISCFGPVAETDPQRGLQSKSRNEPQTVEVGAGILRHGICEGARAASVCAALASDLGEPKWPEWLSCRRSSCGLADSSALAWTPMPPLRNAFPPRPASSRPRTVHTVCVVGTLLNTGGAAALGSPPCAGT